MTVPPATDYSLDFTPPPPVDPSIRRLLRPQPVASAEEDEFRGHSKAIQRAQQIDQTRYAKLEADIGDTGYLPWILAAWEDEKVLNSASVKHMTWEHWVRGCDYALAGTVPEVLNILAKRVNLAKTLRTDKPLASTLKDYGVGAAKEFPSIYVRQLVVGPDQDDITVEQARDIALYIRQYASAEPSKAEEAYIIDKKLRPDWTRELSEDGVRVLTHDKNGMPSAYKKSVLQTFGENIEKAADHAEALNHTHIPTMYYVGYAHKAAERADQHAKKTLGTDALFNLTEYLLEEWGHHPAAVMQPVCLLLTHTYADVAEMFLCRLSQGYYYAGGYNQAPCGNISSVWAITKDQWAEFRMKHNTRFKYREKMEEELVKRKAFQRRDFDAETDRLATEIEKLEADERKLIETHRKLENELDIDHMKNDPFLSQFVADWEKLDAFVKSSPLYHR
ncbi:hypothetical protein C7974DRAFT_389618 [Boeremia exigua]|uniref:uncharacterized protein n=1 Tax=Boeremia exigua TaxID=749465 RepID=UPI001E8CD13D|nr:uncharacterized protein C7974DRAFT_389618 [Boeremia exigua]KAH6637486.1 hypothetical protein C7974DRAFT_389618 [Boeremia exigua]